jgi:hypothetical protein
VSDDSGPPGPGPCPGPDDSCTTHCGAVQLALFTSDSSPASLLYPFLVPRLAPETSSVPVLATESIAETSSVPVSTTESIA